MTLEQIGILTAAVLLYQIALPAKWRGWALMLASLFVIYWLQPPTPIRYLDFALPTFTLLLILTLWLVTLPVETRPKREDSLALGAMVAVVLGVSYTRYLIPELRPLPSRPPGILTVTMVLLASVGIIGLGWRLTQRWSRRILVAILLVLAFFAIIKIEALGEYISEQLRGMTGQSTALASASDLQWLGFSYVAFRLIHTLRDRQMGKLPALSLREYVTYVIFFPAFTAGPIDRAERFVKDFRALPQMPAMASSRIVEGLTRILVGIFKKFAIADNLVLLSLNATNAEQASSTAGMWLLLYTYALRLFFDFSGYSDIAIGIAYLAGIRLPENFDRPYLKNNITTFWQSWHMSLSIWARFYVFTPVSRLLLTRKTFKIPPTLAVFCAQLATMIVIGLWHGVTLPFIVWGIWHGIGLFIHKVWSDYTRSTYRRLTEHVWRKRIWTAVGVLITFHYVTLGWVWFALPDVDTAWTVFLKLFGVWS